MGCLAFSQHPHRLLTNLPSISQCSHLPRPRRMDLPKQALQTGPLVPTQPGPSLALRGTQLTSMVLFKDTAVYNLALGSGGLRPAAHLLKAHTHAHTPTMPW